ncbi:hypothetical protein QQS21_005657 [Conoideocrella luteorostrata]|uniref:Uncharacterized protein n=1 Tax=Conoideocrella luteorostrata TaxID=1105319 RepID=A0AAJ0CNZ3_9HYPO|nr:hypothetical protein QQS21_005657 [Conoideocrella luteorostrata]
MESVNIDKTEKEPTATRHRTPNNTSEGDLRSRTMAPEVKNSSWQNDHSNTPYVDGLSNDDFWALIRRFDKQIFQVKKIEKWPLSNLDMNIAAEEDITEEKLRAHAERLYTSVIIVLISLYKHIVRLRSWREQQRTLWFLGIYSAAWLADLLSVTLLIFLIVSIVYPPSREKFFPSAPAALTSSRTGALKKPVAGVLASDSVTGAPEQYKGETLEQEARSFLNSISALLMGISSGELAEEAQDDNGLHRMSRDLAIVGNMENHRTSDKYQDRTKEPISRIVYGFETRMALHKLPEFIDTWERVMNALSPTRPFPTHSARLILAAWLVPFVLVAYFTTGHMMMKGTGLMVGFVIFGKPVIDYNVSCLTSIYPQWREYVELRNTFLRGVPTNAQLAMTLLRNGEGEGIPLPSPPESDENLNVESSFKACDLSHLGASPEEIQRAISPSSQDDQKQNPGKEDKPSATLRVANRIKRTTKDSVRIVHRIAKMGEPPISEQTQNQQQQKDLKFAGPVRFPARYKNRKGYAYITTKATTPAISWREASDDLELAWTVAIAEVAEDLIHISAVFGGVRKGACVVKPWGLRDGRGKRSRRGQLGNGIVDSESDKRVYRAIINGGFQERNDAVEVEIVGSDGGVEFRKVIEEASAATARRKQSRGRKNLQGRKKTDGKILEVSLLLDGVLLWDVRDCHLLSRDHRSSQESRKCRCFRRLHVMWHEKHQGPSQWDCP